MKSKPLSYVSEHLGLPADIICGSYIVTAYSNNHIYIEHYQGILEYTSERIRIRGKKGDVTIIGCDLCINYYTDNDMRIDGIIKEIHLKA